MALIEFKGLVRAIRELAAAIRGDNRGDIHPKVLRDLPKGITITRADPDRRVFRELVTAEVMKMGLTHQQARRRVAELMKAQYDPLAAHHRRAVPSPGSDTRQSDPG